MALIGDAPLAVPLVVGDRLGSAPLGGGHLELHSFAVLCAAAPLRGG